jgi:hypothetical protein
VTIDYDADTFYDYGIRSYDGGLAYITDVKFTGAFRYAIDMRRQSYIYLKNVHGNGPGKTVTGCVFFGALDHVEYYMEGGIVTDYDRGMQEHGSVRRHYENTASVSEGTQFKRCMVGIYAKEASGGHIDNATFEDCGTGVEFHTYCNANTLRTTFKRCAVGILLTNSEIHNENSMIFGTGVDSCTRTIVSLGSSSELSYAGWTGVNETTIRSGHRPLIMLEADYATRPHTGTTVETTKYTFSERLKGGMYAVQGKRFQVRLIGSVVTPPATSAGVRILVRVASIFTAEVTIPQSAIAGADFEAMWTIICTADGDFQKCFAMLGGVVNSGTAAYAERTIPLKDTSTNHSVAISFISGADADSITLNACELWG